MSDPVEILAGDAWSFVAAARRATLATVDPQGRPRLIPVCFVLLGGADPDLPQPPRLYTPLDEKPKRLADPLALARVRDLLARDVARLLVDRWDEDWSRLGWVRLEGRAQILVPDGAAADERDAAIRALRAKYPQYRRHRLEARPLIRIVVTRASSWGRLGPEAAGPPAAGPTAAG